MKATFKETAFRVLILFIGLTIAHLGVTLFILSNLGSDPFNVLVQGIFRTLSSFRFLPWNITHGTVHIRISFLIIIALLFIDRGYIKIGTVLCMIFGGPIIDGFTILLAPVFAANDSFVFKLLMLALGCIILAYGMTIVIKSEAGTGPNDLVSVVLSDKLHAKFSIVRVITDISFVFIGFLLGGSFGIGTIICAVCVGPVAGIFLPVNEKIIGKLLHKML